jgi:hypothetical protein
LLAHRIERTDRVLPLDSTVWSSLSHAYGSGDEIPGWIRTLRERIANDEGDAEATLRDLLASFAACQGDPALAFVLYELEAGGVKCEHCNNFFQPLRSGFNPFWKNTEE